jgi:hypothetical protein
MRREIDRRDRWWILAGVLFAAIALAVLKLLEDAGVTGGDRRP